MSRGGVVMYVRCGVMLCGVLLCGGGSGVWCILMWWRGLWLCEV